MALRIRVAEPTDIPGIVLLATSCPEARLFASIDAAHVVENASLALVAANEEDMVVGFLALAENTPIRGVDAGQHNVLRAWANQEAKATGRAGEEGAVLHVRALYAFRGYESDGVVEALLVKAFTWLPELRACLLAGSFGGLEDTAVDNVLAFVSHHPSTGATLYAADRADILPPLRTRFALVEDHDDLVPVVARTAAMCPHLATLPGAAEGSSDPFALVRHISEQEDARERGAPATAVFVAEDPKTGAVVGVAAFAADVDARPLRAKYELDPYDNLMSEEEIEERAARDAERDHLYAEAEKAAAALEAREEEKRLIALQKAEEEAKIAAEKEAAAAAAAAAAEAAGVDPAGPAEPAPEATAAEGDAAADAKPEGEDEDDLIIPEPEEPETIAAAEAQAALENADAAAAAAAMAEAEGPPPPCTAFRMLMFCCKEGYDERCHVLLDEAFKHYGGIDHCVFVLPSEENEAPIMRRFTRVGAKHGVISDGGALYIYHRGGMHAQEVVYSVVNSEDEAEEVEDLVEAMEHKDLILRKLRSASTSGNAVIMRCLGTAIGLVVIEPIDTGDVNEFFSNYELDHLGDRDRLSSFGHGVIEAAVVNPVFGFCARALFRAAMRLCGKSVLYYTALMGETVSEPVVTEFCAVAGRRAVHATSLTPMSLFVLPRRVSCEAGRRTCINARVVVTGESDAAVSCCEQLISHPTLRFANLTLLTPSGEVEASNDSTHLTGYTKLEEQRLGFGIGNRCQVAAGKMVGLDRAERVLYLDDESGLQYESLALCGCLYEFTRENLGLAQEEQMPAYKTKDLLGFTLDDIEIFTQRGGFVVFGATLDALCTVQRLESFGVHRDNIRCICAEGCVDSMDPVTALAFETSDVTLEELPPIADVAFASARRDSMTIICSYDDDEGREEVRITCGAMVCCDTPDVDGDVFACVDGSGLVFDGRLVVDGLCRTADPRVYSAGEMAKFSRRLARRGADLRMENLDSRECGRVLARSIASRYAPAGSSTANSTSSEMLPRFFQPCIRGIDVLPGSRGEGLMYASLPGVGVTLTPPAGGSVVGDDSFKMGFSIEGRIMWLLYRGPSISDYMPLSRLVGLGATYLSGAVTQSMEDSSVSLGELLRAPWASALVHESFVDTRSRLIDRLQAAPKSASGDGTKPAGMRSMVHDCMITFCGTHARDLKAYNLPAQ
ncbi:FAP-61 protein [Pseudoscourfieldia marina]